MIHERGLLQLPICCYDDPSTGGFAPRSVNILFHVSLPLSRLRAPVSRRGSAISPRPVWTMWVIGL